MSANLQAVVSLNTSAFTSGLHGMQATAENVTGALVTAFGGPLQEIYNMAQAFGAVGVAAEGIRQVIDVGSAIEDSMIAAVAATGEGAKALEQYGDIAVEQTGRTSFAMTEVASAIQEVAQKGFAAGEQMRAVLAPSLDLAAAAGIATKDAVDQVVGVLKLFSLGAGDAGRVADVLAAGARASGSSIGQMAEALRSAGPTATAMGLSLEETAGTLALFQSRGIEASEAGGMLNQTLTALMKASKESGTAVSNALLGWNPAIEGLQGAMDRLSAAGLSTEQVMKELGVRGGRGLAILLQEGTDALAASTAAMTAQGTAAEQAAIRDLALSEHFKDLVGEVQILANAFYQKLVPALTAIVDAVISVTRAIPNLLQEFRSLIDAGVGRVVDAFNNFDSVGKAITLMVVGLGAAFGLVLPAFVTLVAGIVSGAAAMLTAMWGFIAPVLTGMAAVAVAFAAFSLGEVIANTKIGTDTVSGHFTTFFTGLVIHFQSFVDRASNFFAQLMQQIKIFVLDNAPGIVGAFADWMAPIIENFGKFRAWILDHMGMSEAAAQVREAAADMAGSLRNFDAGVSLAAAKAELVRLQDAMSLISGREAEALKIAMEEAGRAAKDNMEKGIAPAEIFDAWLQQMDLNGGKLWQTLVTGGAQAKDIFTGLMDEAGLTTGALAELGAGADTAMTGVATAADLATDRTKNLGSAFAATGKLALDIKLPFVSEDVAKRWVEALNAIKTVAMDVKIDIQLPFVSQDLVDRWVKALNQIKTAALNLDIDIQLPFISQQLADRWVKLLTDINRIGASVSIDINLPFISQSLADRYIDLFKALQGVQGIDMGAIGGGLSDFTGTLTSIDGSLKTLVQMKGVVWA